MLFTATYYTTGSPWTGGQCFVYIRLKVFYENNMDIEKFPIRTFLKPYLLFWIIQWRITGTIFFFFIWFICISYYIKAYSGYGALKYFVWIQFFFYVAKVHNWCYSTMLLLLMIKFITVLYLLWGSGWNWMWNIGFWKTD